MIFSERVVLQSEDDGEYATGRTDNAAICYNEV